MNSKTMNLANITDTSLIEKTEQLVKEERELLSTILNHLKEIERRRLFSSLGYKSLFDFAVKHLKYSEDQAYRRISAMRLLKELPEIEVKIKAGDISLTHIGLAQSLFKQEKKTAQEFSKEEKINIFNEIAKKPVREAERITLSFSSAPRELKPDKMKVITDNHIELKFTATNAIEEKIERLKGLLAHKHPNLTMGELFDKLCDLGLEKWNPALPAAPKKRSVRREVFRNANSRCENCGSTYALEIDHIIPRALGGLSTRENLRLLCRSCNQRAAVNIFGVSKMEKHLSS